MLKVLFGSKIATTMERKWITDDNRNGTCAYLFCLVEQAVTQIVKGILYLINWAEADFRREVSVAPTSATMNIKQTETTMLTL